jgi:hypothetical protein
MSIPIDRLYQYIQDIAENINDDNVIIYHFYPHGSKKPEDLNSVSPTGAFDNMTKPYVFCYDQEPLDFDRYISTDQLPGKSLELHDIIKKYYPNLPYHNLRGQIISQHDHAVIMHSEKRSAEVEKYQNNYFIPCYYWSHGIIARDWFRYAKYITQKKEVTKLFLVYNRAWSGTREYRLGFADRLIMLGLVDHVQMRVSPVDSTIDKHYDLHHFEHPHWRPRNVIEKHFPLCQAESHYSADFDQEDYESTSIEVVLETLFDDLRLHLTEKTLRPIAMGQPFILAGTYGSLKYLRDYGFKTFEDCWDESYDMMSDSIERMNKITEVMSNIISMPKHKRESMLERAREIAEYNRRHFFSDEFQTYLLDELKNNLRRALHQLQTQNTGKSWLTQRAIFKSNPEGYQILSSTPGGPTDDQVSWVDQQAEKAYQRMLQRLL